MNLLQDGRYNKTCVSVKKLKSKYKKGRGELGRRGTLVKRKYKSI